jgi:hypothetical protein
MAKPIIDVCAYCEKGRDEIVAEFAAARLAPLTVEEREAMTDEALRFVLVSGNRVLLCPDDRRYPADHVLAGELRPPLTDQEMLELLNAPIDLPPGVTALKHHCPMLEFDGFSEDEASFTVELQPEGNYMVGGCTECGMQVRSPVLSDRAAEEHPAEGGE